MTKKYRRLTLTDRVCIQECLDRGDSLRVCAKTIGCAPSTVAREIAANRMKVKEPVRLAKCPFTKDCKAKLLCDAACSSPSMACRLCTEVDCRTVCPAYAVRKSSAHSNRRSHAKFLALSEDIRAGACEMDTVVGRSADAKVLLTLYHKPSDLQLVLLLFEKTCSEVKRALLMVKRVCPPSLFKRLFRCVLTDNGVEFADEDGIAARCFRYTSDGT